MRNHSSSVKIAKKNAPYGAPQRAVCGFEAVFRLTHTVNQAVIHHNQYSTAEKIVIDAEDLLSIARELESSSNIVHINGKEYTGKKSWIANRLREIVASAPINR